MRREGTFEDISDGKLYGINDMVKADCHDCAGCFSCCKGMGDSIILTPYDLYLLTMNLNCSFEQLLDGRILLNVYDGVILPALDMSTGECAFLNNEKRCSIHPFRPGICRLFPLGRIYREDGFDYFLQTNQCKNENRTKIKVSKWLDTPDIKRNEEFIFRWHELIKKLQTIAVSGNDFDNVKKVNMYMLQLFFIMPYDNRDFYEQIEERFEKMMLESNL